MINFGAISKRVRSIKSEVNSLLNNIQYEELSLDEMKKIAKSIIYKINRLDLSDVRYYAELEEPVKNEIYYKDLANHILEEISDIKGELSEIIEDSESELSSSISGSKMETILKEIRNNYSLIKRSQLPSAKMLPDDILLTKIKAIENLIHRLDLVSLEEEVYNEIIDIKNEVSEIKNEVISQAKSRRYFPLLKPALRGLMKKHNIIFNAYPYNETTSEDKFNEILDFLEIPKVLDFYESVIKRIINYTISEKALKGFIESVENSMKNRDFLYESSDFSSSLISLNENYKTQVEIEDFVDDLLSNISEPILAAFNEIKVGKGINRIMKIKYSSLDFSKYPEISKYLDKINGEGIFIHLSRNKKEGFEGIRGSFNKITGNISIFFPISEFSKLINLNDVQFLGQVELFLEDRSLDGVSLRDSIIHEFQHAFDSWRSEGKIFKTSSHIGSLDKIENFLDSGDRESAFSEYLNLSSEISARITQIVSRLKITHLGEIISLRDYIEDFKREFGQWERLSENNKKSIIRKISGIWNKKIENMKNNESENIKIMTLDKYLMINEDFYNPFADEMENKKTRVISHLSDQGKYLGKYKKSYNLNNVEWSRRGGDFILRSKGTFKKGDIIEIAPIILVTSEERKNPSIGNYVFEIDVEKGEYAIVLGYGSLYSHNLQANVEYSYNRGQKAMYFIARTNIRPQEELTINYGSDYWAQREMENSIDNIDAIAAKVEKSIEESEVQPNISDLEQGKIASKFSVPNSNSNPVVSGVAIKGIGQQ